LTEFGIAKPCLTFRWGPSPHMYTQNGTCTFMHDDLCLRIHDISPSSKVLVLRATTYCFAAWDNYVAE